MSPDPRADALKALSHFLVADQPMGDTLLRVSEITLQAVPAADFAGIAMLGGDGKPTTGVYTDEESPEIDKSQYESGRGPCLDAWRSGRVVRLNNMDGAGDDYPEFTTAAKEHGVFSVLSLPMVAGGDGVGALNLYARVPDGFSDEDAEVGTDLAAVAAAVLANASAYWGAAHLGEQLSEAMKSRAVIEQAKGMLMAQSSELGPDDAFDILRKASQRENVKLREIAQRIVERRPVSGRSGA